MGHSNLIDVFFFPLPANYSSQHASAMPTCSELHAESKVGTPTLRSKVKRKRSLLVERARGVHDLGSLGKLWLLFASGGSLESGRELWRTGFPSLWPPVLFPPGLQRLELVKCLGCTDLNSSYSPQKTLALANQPFFSTPIAFLCDEHTLLFV